MNELLAYFTKEEKLLWISSVVLIIASFCIFDGSDYMTLVAFLLNDIYGFVNWRKLEKRQKRA